MILAQEPLGMLAGLPLHPLLVHGAVVLVPLVALGALVMSYLPSFSRRHGKVILGLAIIAQISVFLAKISGEAFEDILNKSVEKHAELGEIAPFVTIPMVVLIYLRWRMDRSGSTFGSVLIRRLTSVALVVASLTSIVFIFLVGHSGAESVWGWIDKL
ncbi:unannotated protein [freshwater metagenome]|jgi:hypothetical protein|uniref:Unannotated protein n=1 Tax=freshwater metagenome TaxID=449393 RepID=A0A6J6JKM0_9ZZZZ|nr:hypothetical protein [Actinomycetota bacterium]